MNQLNCISSRRDTSRDTHINWMTAVPLSHVIYTLIFLFISIFISFFFSSDFFLINFKSINYIIEWFQLFCYKSLKKRQSIVWLNRTCMRTETLKPNKKPIYDRRFFILWFFFSLYTKCIENKPWRSKYWKSIVIDSIIY